MRLMLCVLLLACVPGVAQAAKCKDVHKRYRAKLDAAKYEDLSFRRFTLDYLKNLEGLFAKCFTGKQGLLLKSAREKLAKSKAAPLRKPGDKSSTKAPKKPDENQRRRNFENTYRDASFSTVRRRPRISGGSAAMLSLVIPGAGQAVKDQPVAAWLFFLSVSVAYSAGGAIASAGITANNGRGDTGMVTGGGVLVVIGGIVHIIAVVHAATAK